MIHVIPLTECYATVTLYFCFFYRRMAGNDNEGSQSVYGSDVEIVTSGSVTPTSATASNKVRYM